MHSNLILERLEKIKFCVQGSKIEVENISLSQMEENTSNNGSEFIAHSIVYVHLNIYVIYIKFK